MLFLTLTIMFKNGYSCTLLLFLVRVYSDTICRSAHFFPLTEAHVFIVSGRKKLEIPSDCPPPPPPPPLGNGREGFFLGAGAYVICVRVPSLGPGPRVPAQERSHAL